MATTKNKRITLFCFMQNTIRRLNQLNHSGTARNYQSALNSFKRFRRNKDIPLSKLSQTSAEDYQAYLRALGIRPNSISFYMRILRAVYNRAVRQGITTDRKPFLTVFTGMEKTPKRAISMSDIKRIRNLDLTTKPHLAFARDIFIFLFLCRGMSFIDAAFLKKSDIRDGIISYRRHKTNHLLHIKVAKQIQEIINRHSITDSPYALPIISAEGDRRRQYESALRRTNNNLKKIARMINLPTQLTTYVSRHAWATIAKQKNIPISVISEALGHDSETTTQIYLASIGNAAIDHANEIIIKDL